MKFVALSIEKNPEQFDGKSAWVLINAEVDTREEALEYQQWAEYGLGEVAWIEERP